MQEKKITRADIAEAAEKYKNWGKWGADDEIGTLNYVGTCLLYTSDAADE